VKKIIFAVMLAMALTPSQAEAQLCSGAPSFRDNPLQVAVAAAFTDGAQAVGGEFAGGGRALFGGVGVSVINFPDVDATSTEVSAFGGADLGTQSDRVFVCPAASIAFGTGPDFDPVNVSTLTINTGGSVGIVAAQSGQLMVVPTFGLAAVFNQVSVEFGDVDESEWDTSGAATVGVGFIFNRNVGITPALIVPFSAGDSDVIFSIRLSFGFGG
jgi:hypothetical protein